MNYNSRNIIVLSSIVSLILFIIVISTINYLSHINLESDEIIVNYTIKKVH